MRSDVIRPRTLTNRLLRALGLMAVLSVQLAAATVDAVEPAATEHEVKAAFIYNFTRYLQWPERDPRDPFEIAVLGESPILVPLMAIATTRTVAGRQIAIREVKDLATLGAPEILFLAAPSEARLRSVLEVVDERPVLVVAEEEGAVSGGAAIGLVLRDGNVRLEANETAIRRGGIVPSSQLLKLATLVGGGR